jgi:hypothetical protein
MVSGETSQSNARSLMLCGLCSSKSQMCTKRAARAASLFTVTSIVGGQTPMLGGQGSIPRAVAAYIAGARGRPITFGNVCDTCNL